MPHNAIQDHRRTHMTTQKPYKVTQGHTRPQRRTHKATKGHKRPFGMIPPHKTITKLLLGPLGVARDQKRDL